MTFFCPQDHPAYCKMQMSSREREVFSLEGPANQGKRYFIYKYMLEHVADEHRLKIFMRLCADILGKFVHQSHIIPQN